MGDVFLSYARKDSARVAGLAEALQRSGLSVWWDREIPVGAGYDAVVEDALRNARCVLVVWSRESVKSTWVKEEAAYARERGVLFPVRIDDVDVPIAFRNIQTPDLSNWRGNPESPEVARLMHDIHSLLGKGGEPPPKKWWKFWG